MSRRKRGFKRVVEEFRPVVGFEGFYMVTSMGRVWSCKRVDSLGRPHGGKFLLGKRIGRDRGHLSVCLSRNGEAKYMQIHRLVAEHFIPNPQGKPTVNHINGKQGDNRVENLEWATFLENQSHAWRTGLCKATKPKLTQDQASDALVMRASGASYRDIGMKFGVDAKCIWQIAKGKTYKVALA